jgi:hypothetical protein
MSSSHSSDASKLPVPYKPDSSRAPDSTYHTREWTSGKQGGGSVPDDLEWNTNPKQWQEEHGSNVPVERPPSALETAAIPVAPPQLPKS